jgi:murein DD-endopeptidase MepM/ murein hydrolase activator NlpD
MSTKSCLWFVVTAGLCVALTGEVPARQRTPAAESVDLSVPFPPAIVPVEGRTHLVYELHVTNLQSAAVSLSRLHVEPADGRGSAIAEYVSTDLRTRIGRPGLPRRHPTPHLIDPGMRAVVYLWIDLPPGADAPAALRHRVELEVQRPAGPARAIVESEPVSIVKAPLLVLDPPLRGGPWVAIYDPLLVGGHRTVVYTIDGRARIPGRFAIDWIRLPASGVFERDPAKRGADWNGYGTEVLAVADAVVAAAMDDIPENTDPPPSAAPFMPLENASGNYVALDLGNGRFAFYEHLRRGSISVRPGDRVRSGQVIGRLGNSGSTSIGPHLHFHVSDANSPLGAEGRPFVFTRFELAGAFPSIDALMAGERWHVGPNGPAAARVRERPGPGTVVHFRQP